MIDSCYLLGIKTSGQVVGKLHDVVVRHSGWSGMAVFMGATLLISGHRSAIHHNCTRGGDGYFGMDIYDEESCIHLHPSLSLSRVTFSNGGGANWSEIMSQPRQVSSQEISRLPQVQLFSP